MGRPPKINKQLPNAPIPKGKGKIDIQQAIELRCKGLSYQEIADYFGVAKPSVWEALRPYVHDIEINLDTFKEKRADLMAHAQARTLALLTNEDIQKASARDKVIIFGTLYDKERLERGQSTSNISVLTRAIEDAWND